MKLFGGLMPLLQLVSLAPLGKMEISKSTEGVRKYLVKPPACARFLGSGGLPAEGISLGTREIQGRYNTCSQECILKIDPVSYHGLLGAIPFTRGELGQWSKTSAPWRTFQNRLR